MFISTKIIYLPETWNWISCESKEHPHGRDKHVSFRSGCCEVPDEFLRSYASSITPAL